MQKCSSSADKEKDKKAVCDGFSCKVISDDKNKKNNDRFRYKIIIIIRMDNKYTKTNHIYCK